MKRYLTVGIIFGILVVVIVAISWFAFPGWNNPKSGGFWTLLGLTIIGVFTFIKDAVSVWKDLKEEKKEEQKPLAPLQSINSQHGENVYNAPGGTINIVQPPAKTPEIPREPKTWFLKHRYGLSSHFTGRVDERKFLTKWLEHNNEQPLLVLRALGGFGKSALTWYWLLHDVDKSRWAHVIWWGFYDDNNFETFLKESLEYLQVEVPQSARLQVDALLKVMEQQNVLLVMDGFERALRAFSGMSAAYQLDGAQEKHDDRELDCASPIAEDFLRGVASSGGLMKGCVLMTTRLTPRVLFAGAAHASPLQGMIEHELLQMEPADAVDFFVKQGIRGRQKEIENACALYGFHPLSLRLLAGLILKDKRQPLDIDAASRYKQKVSADAKQRQHHVLEQSYEGLSLESKTLLGRISCFRSSLTYDTLIAIESRGDTSKKGKKSKSSAAGHSYNLDNSLDDLTTRGLLHSTLAPFPDSKINNNRLLTYDLHPIVRRYVYDQLTVSERKGIHTRLIDYFEAVPKPAVVKTLEDLAPVIELYHHLVRAGNLDEACGLFYDRFHDTLYFQFGAYQLVVELLRALFLDGEDKPPCLKKEFDQAWTLTALANAYSLNGQPRRAIPLFETQNILQEKAGDKKNLARGLSAVAQVALLPIGMLKEAEHNLHRQIELCSETQDEFVEAIGHRELGRVLLYRGEWNNSEQELKLALSMFEKEQYFSGQGVTWSYLALWKIIESREYKKTFDVKDAISHISSALNCQNEWTKQNFPIEREKVRNFWLLGSACRANNDLTLAEENLSKALNLCRQINLVEHEADILLELTRLRYAQGDFKGAQEKASEALMITERSGYVLQGADVNLFLAQYALEQEKDKVKAKEYAESALKLATCDGPPYYYKVAYEEAERMLEHLNHE